MNKFRSPAESIIESFMESVRQFSESDDPKVKRESAIHTLKVIELETKHAVVSREYLPGLTTVYLTIGKPSEAGYDVRINTKGKATCTCPAYRFRHRNKYSEHCKHIVAGAYWIHSPASWLHIETI